MGRIRGSLYATRLMGWTLRGSLVADVVVCAVVGAIVAFVVGLVVAPRVDAALFHLRASYDHRTRLPVTDDRGVPDGGDGLHALELLGVDLQKVTDGDAGRAVTAEQVDTRWSASVTMLVVPDDVSSLARWFGSNVPDSLGGPGVLLDRSSAQTLEVGPGERIAVLLPFVSPEFEESVALDIASTTAPYADAARPFESRGLLIVPRSSFTETELAAMLSQHVDGTERYVTVFDEGAPIGQDGDVRSRLGLVVGVLTLQPGGLRLLLGVSGVTIFGAVLWLALGMRADRRARQRSARTRGLMTALGSRPGQVRFSLTAWTAARTALAALAAAALAGLVAFPPVLGHRTQAGVVVVLAGYLLLAAVPQFLWAAIRQRRDLASVVNQLYVVEE